LVLGWAGRRWPEPRGSPASWPSPGVVGRRYAGLCCGITKLARDTRGDRPMTLPDKLSRSLRDRAVLVTGAAGGMGEATARVFADEGARVALADVRADALEAVAESIRAGGGKAQAFVIDVADPDQVRAGVAAAAGHWGGLDILVSNAGVSIHSLVD